MAISTSGGLDIHRENRPAGGRSSCGRTSARTWSWRAVEAAETEFWIEAKLRLGTVGLFALVHRFQTSIRMLRPDWPTQPDRDADLEHHTELAEKLGRAVLRPRL